MPQDAVGRSRSAGRLEQRRHAAASRASGRPQLGTPACIRPTRSGPRARSRSQQGVQTRRERRSARSATTSPAAPSARPRSSSIRRTAACRGRLPAAEKRARAARPRHVRRRPVRHLRGLHALRPLHHARHRRLGAARHLRQRQPHRAGAGHGRDQLRDDSRHARHLHRRPAAHQSAASASTSATRARAGKATSSSSRRRTSPTRRASAPNGNGLRHSDKMKMTERFKRVADDVVQYQFTVDDPVTYAAAVHDLDAADAARRRRAPARTSATRATWRCRTR